MYVMAIEKPMNDREYQQGQYRGRYQPANDDNGEWCLGFGANARRYRSW